MKNAFYIILKAFFILKIFKFLSYFGRVRLFSKFMTLQPGKQKITIHIFSHVSRSKGNQRMEFGQLIEYNMRNIFVKISFRK